MQAGITDSLKGQHLSIHRYSIMIFCMHAGQVVPRIDATCIAVVQGRYPEATTELSDIAAKGCSDIISYHVQYSILLVQGNITVT
ncbi:hypothetical protein TWF103_008206 [Orbilia oligospora]|nr:hypothetical protein TWF103_008206 [Orbilia oligospora]